MTRLAPSKPSRFFLLLAAILALTVVGLPGMAWAQATNANDPNKCGGSNQNSIDQAVASHTAAVAQAKIQAASAIATAFGTVNVRAQACWSNIQKMFSTLGGLTNPFTLIFNMVMQQIMQIVNQACSAVLNVASQVQQFIKSQLSSAMCLPIPKLGLGISGINLNLPTAQPCNGVSLYNPNGSSPRNIINFNNLLPMSTGH